MSVYPTNFHTEPFDPLQIPCRIHGIPPGTKVLGAYATPEFNTLKPLFMLLF